MPRKKITFGKDGGPKRTTAKLGESPNKSAHISHPSQVNIDGHHQELWATATGQKELHKTALARNAPKEAIGYVHSHSNTLFAVSRLDKARGTMEIIKQGKVNAKVHQF